jgi:hypothetical protein
VPLFLKSLSKPSFVSSVTPREVALSPFTNRRTRRLTGPHLLAGCLLAVLMFASCRPTYGDTVYTFEDLPDAYLFSSGDQNIGNFYSGITFGPDVTGLSVSRFGGYDDTGFPPHSGDVVIWDGSDATINISFTATLQSVGIWYTTFDPLTLQTFDAADNLLGTTVGDPNTDGTTGKSSFLSFSSAGIQSITLTSTPGFFVIDDLTIDTTASAVPEPSSLDVVLISISLIVIARPGYCRLHRSSSALNYCCLIQKTPSASHGVGYPFGLLVTVLNTSKDGDTPNESA